MKALAGAALWIAVLVGPHSDSGLYAFLIGLMIGMGLLLLLVGLWEN